MVKQDMEDKAFVILETKNMILIPVGVAFDKAIADKLVDQGDKMTYSIVPVLK